MKIVPESKEALRLAAEALSQGGLVVIPTDTVYGVASSLSPEAVRKLFALKRRPLEKPMALLVSSRQAAEELAVFGERASDAADESWPGALTLVLPTKPGVERVEGAIGDSVGLRVPDHEFTRDLLTATGPLVVTSANLTDEPTGSSIDEVATALGESVSLYIDGGSLTGAPSKVVSFIGEPNTIRDRSPL